MTAPSSVQQRATTSCIVEKLPDGSTAVFDTVAKTVHALDASAAAAFDACHEPITLPALAGAIEQRLGVAVTEETALEAVAELERAGLVVTSGAVEELRNSSRRDLLRAAGVVLPTVLSLTALEQRAFAIGAGSGGGGSMASLSSVTTNHGGTFVLSGSGSGCQTTITIVGANTHFVQGTTTVAATAPATATNIVITVSDATHMTVTLNGGGTIGSSFDFTITTGSEVATVTGLLTLGAC